MKYEGDASIFDVYEWLNEIGSGESKGLFSSAGDALFISTLEGQMTATKGDYIIRGVKGEFYPCKPDIFNETYEQLHMPNM